MADFRLTAGQAGSSADLIQRARAGDLGAFEELMSIHERQVFSVALRILGNREDAQDVSQDAFLRLYRHLGKLREASELRTWLYRVTVNLCNDSLRKRSRGKTEELLGSDPRSGAPSPEASLLESERGRLVELALATLAAKERAAVVLRDVEGLPTREVAEILGSSETTVRSQISSARAKIKEFVDRHMRKRP